MIAALLFPFSWAWRLAMGAAFFLLGFLDAVGGEQRSREELLELAGSSAARRVAAAVLAVVAGSVAWALVSLAMALR